MKTENINNAISIIKKYRMLNDLYEKASSLLVELIDKEEMAKKDNDFDAIYYLNEEMDSIFKNFRVGGYNSMRIKYLIYLGGLPKLISHVKKYIEILKKQIEVL